MITLAVEWRRAENFKTNQLEDFGKNLVEREEKSKMVAVEVARSGLFLIYI